MQTDGKPIRLNGNIHITCAILKLVAASAAEAELGVLFLNTQEAKILRLILYKLGHSQPSTSIHVNKTTAVGIINNTTPSNANDREHLKYAISTYWTKRSKNIPYPNINQVKNI